MKTHQIIKLVRFPLFLLILTVAFAGFETQPARGAELKPIEIAQAESSVTVSGWITVVWGDGGPGSQVGPEPIYYLTDKNKSRVIIAIDHELAKELGGPLGLMKKHVLVQGTWIQAPGQEQKTPTLKAKVIQFQEETETPGALSGPQPWVSILCKFADISSEPNSLPYFEGMYSSAYPGLDHYWREQSFNEINVVGSGAAGWFTLPQPKSYYVYDQNGDGEPDLNHGRILDDCTAVADPFVYYPSYLGINMMFNDNLDCCAWGASGWTLTLDGITQPWNLTWEPPWGYQNAGTIEHEMGHGFGLPHSSGKYGQVYDNQWDVMSDIWTNCDLSSDPTYGCLGQHTISAYKNQLSWIPSDLEFTATLDVTPATITLERLALPQTGNYRIAIIPIQNSSTHYYTVEVRRFAGYDIKLPGQGVIIHEIVDGYAYVMDVDNNGNTGDEGAIWRAGETFSDSANQITVTINSESTTGSNITISNKPSDNLIFRGDFESCDLSAWSPNVVDGGDLSATPAAAMLGNCGMQAAIDDNVSIYVTDDHPNAETRYLASFYFDPNSITMTGGDTHLIFGGYSGTSTAILRVQFRKYSGNYQLQASLLNDGSTWNATSWYTISDGPHQIRLDWRAATGVGANNGSLIFWVDNNQLPELTGVDNDTRKIDRARLGAVNAIDTGTRGVTFFDEFESWRQEATSTATLTVNKTGIGSGLVISDPAGIDCGSTCSYTFTVGTQITLTATADPGSSFSSWGGSCAGTSPTCSFILSADTVVTADFALALPADLIIESITAMPANPQINEAIAFSVVIKNQGQGDAAGFYVDLFIDTPFPSYCSGAAELYQYVAGLAAGASQTLTLNYAGFGTTGEHTVNGIIDTNCYINESDENNNTKTTSLIVGGNLIFSDGFENCDLSAWSPNVIDGGDLSATPAAAMFGTCGMQARIDDNISIYVTSDHPDAETRYRAGFYFDPNSITMAGGDAHLIFGGYSGTSTLVLRVQFRKYSGNYQLQASLLNDGSTWKASSWYTISDASHQIELDWLAATAVGANNGSLKFWVDGNQLPELTGVDNDTRRIDRARLGAVNAIDTGTRGTTYFDEFVSSRGEGGPQPTFTLTVAKTGTGDGTVTSSPPGIDCGSDCSESYMSGTEVTLTATAASGSTFTGWSGGNCLGTGTCKVTMTADTPVIANFDSAPPDDLIFADGFESGNFTAWTANTNDLGDLSVSAAAAIAGNWGMQAVIDDANALFVRDDSPNAEPRYRARFYFDPNSIPMTAGDAHFIFKGFSGTSSSYIEIFRVELHRISTGYEVRASLVNDGTTWTSTVWMPIQDKPNSVELDWRASTGTGANNGGLTLWISNDYGLQQAAISAVDNDTRWIDFVRLGALTGIDAGTRGTYYFDAFESRQQSYIGP